MHLRPVLIHPGPLGEWLKALCEQMGAQTLDSCLRLWGMPWGKETGGNAGSMCSSIKGSGAQDPTRAPQLTESKSQGAQCDPLLSDLCPHTLLQPHGLLAAP